MMHEAALSHTTDATTEPLPDFSGRWVNQLSSRMQLTVNGAQVSGTYESAVSGGGGPIKGELVGFVNGDLIALVVNWPTAAITAWVGQHVIENGSEAINTLWQMTTNIPDPQEPTGLWKSVLAGTDRFHR
jgi:hypothetical protein